MQATKPLQPIQTANDHLAGLSFRTKLIHKLAKIFPPLSASPAESGEHAQWEFKKASGSYQKYVDTIGGLQNKTVLDFGCGWGGETAWLANQCDHATGCDINTAALKDATAFKDQQQIDNVDFVQCTATTIDLPDNHFDAVFSTNVFEHVMNVPAMLNEIHRVLKPGGHFVTSFGPLFYSPLGYHLCWATQVPYAHLWAGLKPVIEVRNLHRSAIHPNSWEETGLNRITFKRFKNDIASSKLQVKKLDRIPVRNLHFLSKLPVLNDLLTFGIDCHLVKPI